MRYLDKIIESYVPLLLSIIWEFSSKWDLLGRLNGDLITCKIAVFTLFCMEWIQDILGMVFVFMVMMMTVFMLFFV